MKEHTDNIIVGLIIGSPITLLTLGLLLNAYKVSSIITTIICGFVLVLVVIFCGFYLFNKRLRLLESNKYQAQPSNHDAKEKKKSKK